MKHLLSALAATAVLMISPLSLAETNSTQAINTEAVVLFVDINTASAEKMADLLVGIGLTKAQAIVDYRTENGPFSAPEDLLDVPGVGPATLAKNRDAIRIGEIEN